MFYAIMLCTASQFGTLIQHLIGFIIQVTECKYVIHSIFVGPVTFSFLLISSLNIVVKYMYGIEQVQVIHMYIRTMQKY